MQSSLIIATYNWPEALDRCLQSVMRQTIMPTEIIIADDGSGPATKVIIEKYKQQSAVPIVHVWHEDKGFQLAQIRNKAAAVAKEYIIQVDGDLILHPQFVKDHLLAATKNKFICGSRVMLNKTLTTDIIQQQNKNDRFGIFSKNISNKLNSLHLPLLSNIFSFFKNQNSLKSIRGCNMAYWRSDFIAVNGYNENFIGWGREDTDLVIRFSKLGLKRRFFKFQGIVYHLYHKENDRANLKENDKLLAEAMSNPGYTCAKGVSQYL